MVDSQIRTRNFRLHNRCTPDTCNIQDINDSERETRELWALSAISGQRKKTPTIELNIFHLKKNFQRKIITHDNELVWS